MTAGPAFPGSRTLAGWWQQLALYLPRCVWVGHLPLVRVEAPVRFARTVQPDRFSLLLLEALACHSSATAEKLDQTLHVGLPVLRQALRHLKSSGLVEADAANVWNPTALGQAARLVGHYVAFGRERRTFYFHRSQAASPQFLNLVNPATVPWPTGDDWKVDSNVLQKCILRSSEWKRTHGFPLDIEEVIVDSEPTAVSEPESAIRQGVICHQPECLAVVLLKARTEPRMEHLVGFEFDPNGWKLNSAKAVLDLLLAEPDLYCELTPEPPAEQWRHVWMEWGKANGLTQGETANCALEVRNHRLQVYAPRSVLDKLRAMRNEVLRGRIWVLAGNDLIRTAALLDIGPRGDTK